MKSLWKKINEEKKNNAGDDNISDADIEEDET